MSRSSATGRVDLLRASGLPLADAENPEVARDLSKVKFRTRLSPVLLVRGEPLVIADGYNRVCAASTSALTRPFPAGS